VKLYAISLTIAVLVGVIYGLFNVRSPAAPVIALVGLAGMLLGEQILPLGKRMLTRDPVNLAALPSKPAITHSGNCRNDGTPHAPALPALRSAQAEVAQ